MTKEEYRELLKDGRWQRKRLEIMQRDDFKCTKCGTTSDLNVHHLRYIPGRSPWEYEDEDLITLCGTCHKQTHEDMERKEKEQEEYEECLWRAKQLSGMLLYYKKIGEYHDVITMQVTTDYGCYADFDVFFFYRNVYPIDNDRYSWMFHSGASGNPIILDTRPIEKHIWHNEPDEVLTAEEFEVVREGFMSSKDYFEYGDNLCEWNLIKKQFDKAQEKYKPSNVSNIFTSKPIPPKNPIYSWQKLIRQSAKANLKLAKAD